jgi:hypothetical protein
VLSVFLCTGQHGLQCRNVLRGERPSTPNRPHRRASRCLGPSRLRQNGNRLSNIREVGTVAGTGSAADWDILLKARTSELMDIARQQTQKANQGHGRTRIDCTLVQLSDGLSNQKAHKNVDSSSRPQKCSAQNAKDDGHEMGKRCST